MNWFFNPPMWAVFTMGMFIGACITVCMGCFFLINGRDDGTDMY